MKPNSCFEVCFYIFLEGENAALVVQTPDLYWTLGVSFKKNSWLIKTGFKNIGIGLHSEQLSANPCKLVEIKLNFSWLVIKYSDLVKECVRPN